MLTRVAEDIAFLIQHRYHSAVGPVEISLPTIEVRGCCIFSLGTFRMSVVVHHNSKSSVVVNMEGPAEKFIQELEQIVNKIVSECLRSLRIVQEGLFKPGEGSKWSDYFRPSDFLNQVDDGMLVSDT